MNQNLLWALLLAWGAGVNLYLTLLLAGLVGRMQWIRLPQELDFLTTTWSLAIVAALFLVEFVADKIPYVDSFWDAVHTFIRVPAGILLALGAAYQIPGPSSLFVALVGGFIAFGTHGAKSTVRLALNSTPEPFTNWFVSLAEDGSVAAAYWLFLHHPRILVVLLFIATVVAWFIVYLLRRFFVRLLQFRRPRQLRQASWNPGPKRYKS
ncbi:MAG: DUF4126 domain-containing protein [Acidobacteria bacterium]|nr:DUF4126 domain-containing protein [Acidobacteriota bacterium]